MKKVLPLILLTMSLVFISGNSVAGDKWSQKFAEKYSYNHEQASNQQVFFGGWSYSWRYGWKRKNLFWWKKKKVCRIIWWCKPVSRS